MKWTDIYQIAIALEEEYPEQDIETLRFTDLHKWVVHLPGFDDDPRHSNERILEAIQAAWLEERE